VVIGVSLLGGAAVSLVTVAAVFLSNVPEGLSSAAGMRKAGRSAAYIFGVWGSIAVASGIAARHVAEGVTTQAVKARLLDDAIHYDELAANADRVAEEIAASVNAG
jgi:hypothetical protein